MGLKRTDGFHADAVRIVLTSGLTTARQLIRSINERGAIDTVSKEDLSLAGENDRRRREVRNLKEERDIFKKATLLSARSAASRRSWRQAERIKDGRLTAKFSPAAALIEKTHR